MQHALVKAIGLMSAQQRKRTMSEQHEATREVDTSNVVTVEEAVDSTTCELCTTLRMGQPQIQKTNCLGGDGKCSIYLASTQVE